MLMVRHPLSVALSWLKLGWGAAGSTSDFQVIVNQPELFEDFPVFAEALKRVDVESPLERILFQWCVFHAVPVAQLNRARLRVLYYEDLLLAPHPVLADLFASLGMSCDWERVASRLASSSRTSFIERPATVPGGRLDDWMRAFSSAEIQRAREILAMFSLEDVYAGAVPANRDRLQPAQVA